MSTLTLILSLRRAREFKKEVSFSAEGSEELGVSLILCLSPKCGGYKGVGLISTSIERGAGFFLPGELGVSPRFFKVPQSMGD